MRAPGGVEAAVHRHQRRHLHAALAPAAAPRRRRNRAAPSSRRPAPARRRPAVRGARRPGRRTRSCAVAPAQPAVAHVEAHAGFRAGGAARRAAAAPPSCRSGTRGRTADEGIDAEAVDPGAHLLRREALPASADLGAPLAVAAGEGVDGSEWVMFMPPLPANRNLRPTEGMASYRSTCTPPADSTSAAIRPAGPPPTTMARRSERRDSWLGSHGPAL
jgi:hypothetical protein